MCTCLAYATNKLKCSEKKKAVHTHNNLSSSTISAIQNVVLMHFHHTGIGTFKTIW